VAILVLLPLMVSLAFAIVWNVTYPRFLAHLRINHSSVWDGIGRPHPFGWRLKPPVAAVRFLIGRGYLALNDQRLNRLGDWSRASFAGVLFFAILFAASGLLIPFPQAAELNH
jgi:hypothetical protein